MKKLLFTAAVTLGMGTLYAQFTYDYLKAADAYFKKGEYYSAAQYYEKYLGVQKERGETYNPYVVQASSKKAKTAVSSREQALYNTAESYRQLSYYEKAE